MSGRWAGSDSDSYAGPDISDVSEVNFGRKKKKTGDIKFYFATFVII